MLIRYIIRNLKKRLFLNLIKIAGLSLALSAIVFIVLYLHNELTFERFHKKSERIYRFTYTDPNHFAGNHFARNAYIDYMHELKDYFPAIEEFVRLAPAWGDKKYKQNYIKCEQAFICDSSFYSIFDVQVVTGKNGSQLKTPGSLIVSESLAKRVFGNIDPVGEVMTIPTQQYDTTNQEFTVSAVMKDFPKNSHFHPEILLTALNEAAFKDWSFTYLLLNKNTGPADITSRFKNFMAGREGKDPEKITTKAYLQNIRDIHLHSHKLREIEKNNTVSMVYLFVVAALILLIISISNYTNLNLGMSGFYSKYLNMNKLLGSNNISGFKYFLTEGVLTSLISLVITVPIIIIGNFYTQKELSINLLDNHIPLILIVLGLYMLIVILVSCIPALRKVLNGSRFNEKKAKTILLKESNGSKGLIVLQFTFCIILVIAVITLSKQTNFMLKRSIGASSSDIIEIEANLGKFQLFRDEIQKLNSIEDVSASFAEFGGETNDMFAFEMDGYQKMSDDSFVDKIGVFPCDYKFPSFFKLRFLAGRDFSKNTEDAEGSGEYIINKAALHQLQYQEPEKIIGKDFQIKSNSPYVKIPLGKIIGVVDDFHLSSMKKKVVPLVLFKMKEIWLFTNVVRIKEGMHTDAISDMKAIWGKLYPGHPFVYRTAGESYNEVYKTERIQSKLLLIFTIIAIFICSMGLLGITLIIVQKRIKEIGIRKVNGARVKEILYLINKDILLWMSLALFLACPLAGYSMNKWLQNFAYHVELQWWIYLESGTIVFFIVLITTAWLSVKTAKKNPVETLRYE